jgi:hypothetical protein
MNELPYLSGSGFIVYLLKPLLGCSHTWSSRWKTHNLAARCGSNGNYFSFFPFLEPLLMGNHSWIICVVKGWLLWWCAINRFDETISMSWLLFYLLFRWFGCVHASCAHWLAEVSILVSLHCLNVSYNLAMEIRPINQNWICFLKNFSSYGIKFVSETLRYVRCIVCIYSDIFSENLEHIASAFDVDCIGCTITLGTTQKNSNLTLMNFK